MSTLKRIGRDLREQVAQHCQCENGLRLHGYAIRKFNGFVAYLPIHEVQEQLLSQLFFEQHLNEMLWIRKTLACLRRSCGLIRRIR